jgi:tRNA pseudouridine38-40 synthase
VTIDEPAFHQGGGLVRLRLDLSYDGTEFAGWAVQPDVRTVQGEIENALEIQFRSGRLPLTVAGRTDAGVHATGQVAHVDVPRAVWEGQAAKAVRRLNGLLPADVRVHRIVEAPDGFDARFSAVWRRYVYRIADADEGAPPLRRHDTVAWRRRLDAAVMQDAASQMLGLHDFAAFCKRRDNATTIRTLQALSVCRAEDGIIEIRVQADAFCHSMVRSLVGGLAAVGEGRRSVDWPASLLTLGERSSHVAVAPAHGLTLVEVGYAPDEELALRQQETRSLRSVG